MSTAQYEVNAVSRKDFGKGASRRLRRENMVPAIVYGGEGEPEPVMLKHNEVVKQLSNDGFYSQILMLSVDGSEPIRALLRDVQRHPYRQQILHLDFQRIVAGAELTLSVSLHFINEDTCPGAKAGGIISHLDNEVAVACLPRNIPEYIEVDMANLDIGDSFQLSEVIFPEGVRSVDLSQTPDNDRPIASISAPKIEVEPEVDADDEESPDVPTAKDEAADKDDAADKDGGTPETSPDTSVQTCRLSGEWIQLAGLVGSGVEA